MNKTIRRLAAFALASSLAPNAVAQNTSTPASAAPNTSAATTDARLAPADNLRVEGIPAIPLKLADDVRRYTEFRSAGLADWHPTRREILINTRFGDTNQLHEVRMPGGARLQRTFFPENVGGGAYEPKRGRYFVFSKDRGGDEFSQLYRHDFATGKTTLLTDGGRSQNGAGAWSTGGDRIAYGSTRRNGRDRDIYVMNPNDPKSDRLALQVDGGGWGALDWSPDDKQLIIRQGRSINDSSLYLLDLASGQKRLLTEQIATATAPNAETVSYGGARFSADGRGLYVTTDRGSEFMRLAYVDLASGEQKPLTADINHDVDDFELTEDGALLAFVTNEDGRSVLRVMETKTGKRLDLPQLPVGTIGGLTWREGTPELGFTLSTARTPADVYSIDTRTGKLERWTESETGGISVANLKEPELVKWKSFDQREISGFLYRPPAKFTGKRPVVINIHGGPEGQAVPNFLGRANYYLDELGVAIIFPNVRGSSGYGKTFLKLDNGIKREDTYKDIGALFDWIKGQPDLDADRVMITGGSYGGHMVFAVATYYPDRIRAALPVVGISNFISFMERTEAYRVDLRRVEYGDERDPAIRAYFERTAPLNNAAKIKAPMFVVQGANDPRVPLNESEQMVRRVRQNSTPVWYLVANDEGHGFRKKRNQDFQFYATVMFMREYLLK